MNRPIAMTRAGGPVARPTAAPPPSPTPPPRPSPPGTDAAALAELRSAAFTYDYLREKGDPVQFWETLRLARSRRALDGAAAPTPAVEQSLLHELELIRRNHAEMVRNLRALLKSAAGVPEPADRFEMALAFLMASTREHQAVAKWLAAPEALGPKAAEKLRSLANITDPYREALAPWVLQAPVMAAAPAPVPEATFIEVEEPARRSPAKAAPAAKAAPIDPALVDALRRSVQCLEILSGLYLEAQLWETTLMAAKEPDRTQATLQVLAQDAEGEHLEELQADGEALFAKTTEARARYTKWIDAVRGAMADKDSDALEVALALTVSAPSTKNRVILWLDDPAARLKESVAMVEQWLRQADEYLKAAGV